VRCKMLVAVVDFPIVALSPEVAFSWGSLTSAGTIGRRVNELGRDDGGFS
jgi:hypothetical protein